MPDMITFDKDGLQIPSQPFLSMVIIMLKKCEKETGGESLISWLESFEERDNDIDGYNDTSLRKAVYKMLKENYLDKEEEQRSVSA